ncbi:MAG: DEAD/DEAH box helicase family protein [Bacteroidetes bacterium]|nr:DEAD/DEAH box helicase family protein [Bacteroidota bacterium]
MNEAETRAELIDPALKASGWGVVETSKIHREFPITSGKIQVGGSRGKQLIADYILEYKGRKLAVVEAKSIEVAVGEGVAQAKNYAGKLQIAYAYSCNGKEIYQVAMESGKEMLVTAFPSPEELWNLVFSTQNSWRDAFNAVPIENVGGTKKPRFYQEIAVNKTMEAIADQKPRILLTMATGTGKTYIAFQIAWKLFQTRWNLTRYASRRPRILFLADRNILADQAFNAFSAFPEDALVRIKPDEVRKNGRVPTNGSIFFTIFQTFMSGTDAFGNSEPYFGEYPKDYFDFIIIDECHRGGANDESNWRSIMEYFSPAVQLGLTATPKRQFNMDTYHYFGEPVYTYSLKEGINDGFLTPFRVKRIQTTIDNYIYTPDDQVVEGEIEYGKKYVESDFNRIIEIREREAKRVRVYMDDANQKEKAIVFCATQDHAAAVRELINQYKKSTDPNYCVRVTANDGLLGEQYLREFQDNEKSIPTILTTSQKLSTGVDALNIRNIVLLRPINTMIEFKQIIGRGTRLFDGKDFFTIYDYVDAYHHFLDEEWDGPPSEPEPCPKCNKYPCECVKEPPKPCLVCGMLPCICEKPGPEPCPKCGKRPCVCIKKTKIKLADGKEREIQHMTSTSFWSADGKILSLQEFLDSLFGTLPGFFTTEEELRALWSIPMTRKSLLDKLATAGFGKDQLITLQALISAEKSDLFDVLDYIAFATNPITREERVATAQDNIFALLDHNQKEFVEFVLAKYIESGVEELDQEKLPALLELKYQAVSDATDRLGGVGKVKGLFVEFQKYLYEERVA